MFLALGGTICAALDRWPLAPILLVLNCVVWTIVGRAWREPTVWVTNAIAGGISLAALLVKLFDRSF
jgi:hypothetical protein